MTEDIGAKTTGWLIETIKPGLELVPEPDQILAAREALVELAKRYVRNELKEVKQ